MNFVTIRSSFDARTGHLDLSSMRRQSDNRARNGRPPTTFRPCEFAPSTDDAAACPLSCSARIQAPHIAQSIALDAFLTRPECGGSEMALLDVCRLAPTYATVKSCRRAVDRAQLRTPVCRRTESASRKSYTVRKPVPDALLPHQSDRAARAVWRASSSESFALLLHASACRQSAAYWR